MKEYFKLLRFLKGHLKLFIPAVFLMFLSSIFEGVQLSMLVPLVDIVLTQKKIVPPAQLPAFLQQLIAHLNNIPPSDLLLLLAISFIPLILIKNAVTFFYGFIMSNISQCVMRDIRTKLYHTIQNLSLDYFSKKRSGELISRITNDVQVIENALSYAVTDLVRQSFLILVYIGIVMTIDWKVALIIFIMGPLIGIPVSQIGKKLRKLSKSTQEKMADINSLLLETITGIEVVKAFGMEPYEIARFTRQNQDYYKLKMKSIRRLLSITPITEVIGTLFGVGIMLWMGRQIIAGQLSFGLFGLFFGSILMMMQPIKKLGNVNVITQQALAASKRIYEILDARPTVVEKPDAIELSPIKERIQFQNVEFRYETEEEPVLRDITLTIGVGKVLAIVGPTGAGKSTLAKLIPRFYDPTKGTILIDGTNLQDVTLESLRRQIGIVTQETILFNDTVKANIAYGHLEASFEAIEEAAKKAFAHRFIVNLPQGYDTVIGDRGFRLSGGEKQRIAIARAILKNPPILILDEATSQLDSESERFVQEALDKLMEGRTVICIAHRLSTIQKAQKIVVLEKGKIIGSGTHSELLKGCPLYDRLYRTQFQYLK